MFDQKFEFVYDRQQRLDDYQKHVEFYTRRIKESEEWIEQATAQLKALKEADLDQPELPAWNVINEELIQDYKDSLSAYRQQLQCETDALEKVVTGEDCDRQWVSQFCDFISFRFKALDVNELELIRTTLLELGENLKVID